MGRPVVASDVKLLQYENANDISRELNDLVTQPLDELTKIINNHKLPAMKVLLARIVVKAANEQDPTLIKIIMDRLVGPVKERIDINLSGGMNINKYVVDYIAQLEEAKKSK